MFTDRVEARDFRKMPQEYQDLTIRMLLIHAEGELTGSDVYARKFFLMAPNGNERFICARFCAEEVDHYRKTAAVLADLGIDTDEMVTQEPDKRPYYPTEFVRADFPTWEHRACFSFIGENVAHFQLREMAESSYLPLASIVKGIIREENGHVGQGRRILEETCATEEGRDRAQKAVDDWWPIALDAFGRADSKRSERYIQWGLKVSTNEEARRAFITEMTPRIERLGLKAPQDHLAGRKVL